MPRNLYKLLLLKCFLNLCGVLQINNRVTDRVEDSMLGECLILFDFQRIQELIAFDFDFIRKFKRSLIRLVMRELRKLLFS